MSIITDFTYPYSDQDRVENEQDASSLDGLVFFLHGYGADGQNLIDIAYSWHQALTRVRFFSPNAPSECDAYSSGYQWFPLPADREERPEYIQRGLSDIRPIVKDYIEEKCKSYNVPLTKAFVVGFSQGGMIALTLPWVFSKLGGVIAYSSTFFDPGVEPLTTRIPILLVHGTEDGIIPYMCLHKSQMDLVSLHFKDVRALTCKGLDHSIDASGIKEGLDFIKEKVAPSFEFDVKSSAFSMR